MSGVIMITEDVKQVYNEYLKTLAKSQNRGFRYRRNFDKFDDEHLVLCNKIVSRLKLSNIDSETFFDAPIQVMNDFTPTLQFYATYPAIKCYTTWVKQRQNLPPDHPYQLQAIKKSLQYIVKYCTENDIEWDQFIYSDALTPHWMHQLKSQQVSIYALMGFPDFKQQLDRIDDEIKALIIQNISDNYVSYRRAYHESSKARELVIRGSEACKLFLKRK